MPGRGKAVGPALFAAIGRAVGQKQCPVEQQRLAAAQQHGLCHLLRRFGFGAGEQAIAIAVPGCLKLAAQQAAHQLHTRMRRDTGADLAPPLDHAGFGQGLHGTVHGGPRAAEFGCQRALGGDQFAFAPDAVLDAVQNDVLHGLPRHVLAAGRKGRAGGA
jgi:hypothetical protein